MAREGRGRARGAGPRPRGARGAPAPARAAGAGAGAGGGAGAGAGGGGGGGGAGPPAAPRTAREAVERGTAILSSGTWAGAPGEALELFELATQMDPSEDEARAALYNMACALSRLGRFRDAQEPLLMAVNELGVKYSVCAEDPDLEDFRNSSEWLEIQDYMVGGAGAESREAKLRAEATQPFLLARLLVLGGLDLGALTGLLIITPRLLAALSGVEGSDLPTAAKDFAINLVASGVLSFFVFRDLKSRARAKKKADVEGVLGRLCAVGPGGRPLPLSRLRGNRRAVIVAGSRGYVKGALGAAAPFRAALEENAVSVVAVVLEGGKVLPPSKATSSSGGAPVPDAQGFGKAKGPPPAERAPEAAPEPALAPSRFQLEPALPEAWEAWVSEQMQEAGGDEGRGLFVQLQLDGTVRSSGLGTPDWDDLAQLTAKTSVVAKITGQ